MSRLTHAELVARGCTCGGEHYTPCPIHTKPGDNRGIRAWFEAGMPLGLPMRATCMVCRNPDCLIYPDVDQLDPAKPFVHRPTLVCPQCSVPAVEYALIAESVAAGLVLNETRVFPLAAAA